jgi:hypothetical protein
MTIELQGLTKQQYQIAELLWSCDTQAQVEQLKSSLPPEYRRQADVVHELMIAAVFDQYEDIDEYTKTLIDHCRSR